MNETIVLYNTSTVRQCFEETIHSMANHLLSLVRMEQAFDANNKQQNNDTKYEVTFIPVIILLLIAEQIIRLLKRQDLCRFQDVVVNTGAALIFVLTRSLVISVIVFTLYSIHENYRIIDLPIDSMWTWILTLLMGELSTYWAHRAMHEINFLWAAHHFHHMTEDLNVSATIRATFFDLVLYDLFPLPLAFIIPPQLLVFHMQLSFLYQIWLHNEVVSDLGFIEYVLITPRQHRVHHGRNRFCIDKNYCTFLSIWDKVFGTHQPYLDQEKPVFGLVSPTPKTYDSIALQLGYYKELMEKCYKIEGFINKISVLVKGPGWAPGKPRLGCLDDVPDIDESAPKYGYNPYICYWKKFYALIHSSVIALAFMQLADHLTIIYTSWKGFVGILYIILFLTSIGAIFDNRQLGAYLEIIRCLMHFGFEYYFVGEFMWNLSENEFTLTTTLLVIRMIYIFSIIFWLIHIICNRISKQSDEKPEPEVESKPRTANIVKDPKLEKHLDSTVEKTLFILAIIFIIISFLFAYTLYIKSCDNILNQILVKNT